MSQRSRLPPQQSDACEQPSTDVERPSKPDLMCPTCGTFLVNVGNLNRHRRDLHRWVNPDKKRLRKAQPHPVLDEGNFSGPPSNTSEPASCMADSDLPIIPPFPPPEDVGDISQYSSDGQAPSYPQADISSGYVDDVTADPASYVQIEAPTPIRLPALTNSSLLSVSSDPFATPSPPYVARTLGRTLGGDIWSREDHSFATGFSSPVDDGYHSSDAMESAIITDRDDVTIFEFGTTHSSVPSHRSTEFDVVKGSDNTPYQLQRARAPRHLNPLPIAGREYPPQFWPTTHALPVETMHFPPVPPPEPGSFRSDAMEVGYMDKSNRRKLIVDNRSSHCNHKLLPRNMEWREDRTTSGVPVRPEPNSSSKKVIRVSGPCQYAGTSPPTHVLTQMDFEQRALQASTSYPQQAYHTPLFSAQSGDHLVCLSEQAPYERSAHSAFDSHRHPELGEHLQARYASFDEIAHYLNDPANNAPNFFGNFNPCCPESDMSAF